MSLRLSPPQSLTLLLLVVTRGNCVFLSQTRVMYVCSSSTTSSSGCGGRATPAVGYQSVVADNQCLRLPSVAGADPQRCNELLLLAAAGLREQENQRSSLGEEKPETSAEAAPQHHVLYFPGDVQAFAHVSKLLSQCKFDLLEELVTKEVLQVLKEKVAALPDNYKNALAAEIDEIVYTATGDISIYYDDKGRKFVHILMCFWYLTSANLPEETLSGTKIFQVQLGDQNVETKQLLSANYEFQREFTQGVKPDWTIARIEHSKLLE
ncbi:m-AAA protease-interacting protein 1, mitochondrial isoform X3 [Monodelphis domestica]|uniref:m-AAA protease-interacting protein 1, mitochondrial isoform X3 n=1 Tax=Monodelphis domestica TaxID=13616 RepID=UPI0007B4029C|nr:m-AAA protease-interacting protein 1, mitochondrial isoform X3 [Monodelphis domestica]